MIFEIISGVKNWLGGERMGRPDWGEIPACYTGFFRISNLLPFWIISNTHLSFVIFFHSFMKRDKQPPTGISGNFAIILTLSLLSWSRHPSSTWGTFGQTIYSSASMGRSASIFDLRCAPKITFRNLKITYKRFWRLFSIWWWSYSAWHCSCRHILFLDWRLKSARPWTKICVYSSF